MPRLTAVLLVAAAGTMAAAQGDGGLKAFKKAVEIDGLDLNLHRRADGSEQRRQWRIRYLHPDQLDELCARAGLTLVGRWSDWHASEFTATATRHVSAYALA